MTSTSVDWHIYAQKYDMLLAFNPYYQHLHQTVLNNLEVWKITTNSIIADVGAGTGNYSIALAEKFPLANVLHIDNNAGMNAAAITKIQKKNIQNLQVLSLGIDEVNFEPESLQGIVSVHALYTFPDPQEALKKMYNWLAPGGFGILVDAGRIVRVWEWQLAISFHLIRNYGITKTLELFREAKIVSEQNKLAREMQKNGTFWTHSHEEFCDSVQNAGFSIVKSQKVFRNISDLVIVRKP